MKITIYTDGSSRGNPGPGGWAAILIVERQQTGDNREYENQDEVIELGGYEDHTTNNRMELRGTIEGLRHINDRQQSTEHRAQKDSERQTINDTRVTSVEVCTDSQYVKKGISEWIEGWKAKGWKTSTKKQVLNQDLWEELHAEENRLKDRGVKVSWVYVPGHAGVPLNERADVIATSCADSVIEKGATNLQLYRGPKTDYEYF
jgi:ribonuclease HI